jgi:site-specific recombinase XerD
VPLHEVQAILGHAQLSTTMIYVHSIPEGIRKAADQMGDTLWGTGSA